MSADLSFINTVSERLVERNQAGFKYCDFHYGSHDKQRFRLWINRMIQLDSDPDKTGEYLQFPVEDAVIDITEKGTYVLRYIHGFVTHCVTIRSGYRGGAMIQDLRGGSLVKEIKLLHSQTGSLGETHMAFIYAPIDSPVDIQWRRSGRKVDQNEGWFEVAPNGEVIEVLKDHEAEAWL